MNYFGTKSHPIDNVVYLTVLTRSRSHTDTYSLSFTPHCGPSLSSYLCHPFSTLAYSCITWLVSIYLALACVYISSSLSSLLHILPIYFCSIFFCLLRYACMMLESQSRTTHIENRDNYTKLNLTSQLGTCLAEGPGSNYKGLQGSQMTKSSSLFASCANLFLRFAIGALTRYSIQTHSFHI